MDALGWVEKPDLLRLITIEPSHFSDGFEETITKIDFGNFSCCYNLVLLDLYMPEMDGFEVLSLMKEDERLSQIPVVVMSSNESNDIIGNCLKMGAENYLVKPVRI